MQNHEYFYPVKFALPFAPEAVETYLHAPLVSALNTILPSGVRPITPFERVELQPSEIYPKNFIIFDQIDNQSRIMFRPAMANKFSGPGWNVHATYNQEFETDKANPLEGELSFPFEEDSKDIDALLSLEGEELEVSHLGVSKIKPKPKTEPNRTQFGFFGSVNRFGSVNDFG